MILTLGENGKIFLEKQEIKNCTSIQVKGIQNPAQTEIVFHVALNVKPGQNESTHKRSIEEILENISVHLDE